MSTIHELTYTSRPGFICNVCHNQGSGPVHECPACQFHVHPSCAASNAPPRSLLHWAHPNHSLSLHNNISHAAGVQISCNACGQRVVGSVYSCRSCNFHLDPVCASLPRQSLHSQHPQHRLELLPMPPYSNHAFGCNACSEKGTAWVYHCRICQFDLHLSCANLRHVWLAVGPQSEARMLQRGAGSANEPPRMWRDQQWRPPASGSQFGPTWPPLGRGNSQSQAPINVTPHQQHPMPRPISYGSQLGTRVMETAVMTATQAAVNYAFHQHPGGTYGNNSYGNNSTGSYADNSFNNSTGSYRSGGNVDNSLYGSTGSYVDNSGGGSYDYSLYGSTGSYVYNSGGGSTGSYVHNSGGGSTGSYVHNSGGGSYVHNSGGGSYYDYSFDDSCDNYDNSIDW